jgi:PGF-CTERM protein
MLGKACRGVLLGFEAVFAVIGLLAVSYLVLSRGN